jgi:hypothetical protein
MNTQLIRLGLAPALLLAGTLVQADHFQRDPYALEPSINGGVSATGMFASQAEEDRYFAERRALELEPCVNGGVSATGMFASQAEEDEWLSRIAGG